MISHKWNCSISSLRRCVFFLEGGGGLFLKLFMFPLICWRLNAPDVPAARCNVFPPRGFFFFFFSRARLKTQGAVPCFG